MAHLMFIHRRVTVSIHSNIYFSQNLQVIEKIVTSLFPKDNAMCTVNNNFLFVVLELDGSTLIDRVYIYDPPPPPNRIGGVMVSVLASSAVDRGFESQFG